LYTWIPEEFLHHISLLGEQGPGDGEADRSESAELSEKSPQMPKWMPFIFDFLVLLSHILTVTLKEEVTFSV
jgi:hypothetical protein